MEESRIKELKEQNKSSEMQSGKAEDGLQKETVGKIIYDYIKKEIDRKI